ncbi:MAG: hypothetical protein CL915_07515 [Deltaproteobacteria bacterium]|nr:hypothetical protein [Deltaproteobacteria bacterium]
MLEAIRIFKLEQKARFYQASILDSMARFRRSHRLNSLSSTPILVLPRKSIGVRYNKFNLRFHHGVNKMTEKSLGTTGRVGHFPEKD